MSRATHAVVSQAALDLRPAPDHRAELASQLLLGECVRLLGGAGRGGWRRVKSLTDGYEGWVREWGLVPASAQRAGRWRRLATAVVSRPFLHASARPGAGIAVSPLFLGSRLIAGRRSGSHRAVELPDGRRGWVEATGIRREGEPPVALLVRVTSLLGAPYLWGGRTAAGLDCSAFSQLVLAEQGMALPRDAGDQHRASRALSSGVASRPGDLAFFARRGEGVSHVGVALGDGYFAHSRGMVCIASIDASNTLCDKALRRQFVGWYRVGTGG